ncbi:hypothetical protein TNCT_148871 [Trichonephila clavata]|uniref:Uncharacterized protein n=1 Tax=Trichonephila clavata TaxID=2740835 RepID=A0A8X6J1W3_TRICU|nr:hypothetical protein TNCT_148871 [Trichonephila clavata]
MLATFKHSFPEKSHKTWIFHPFGKSLSGLLSAICQTSNSLVKLSLHTPDKSLGFCILYRKPASLEALGFTPFSNPLPLRFSRSLPNTEVLSRSQQVFSGKAPAKDLL